MARKFHYEHDLYYLMSILADNGGFTAKNFELVSYKTCYRDWETDRKSTRLNSSHSAKSRMPSSA